MTATVSIVAAMPLDTAARHARDHALVTASGWEAPHSGISAPIAGLQLREGRLALDDLAYMARRYDEEMQAGKKAKSTGAKIAHYELAHRYALRARDSRTNMQL